MFYTNTCSPVKPGSKTAEPGVYTAVVKQIATLRVNQVAAKVGDQAPMTAVCCNACRTCVTTNLVAAALAGLGAVWAFFSGRASSSA
jgi:hypothetical protein